ncbi:MAG: hypothetical protein LBU90_02870 [Bacteroidales bacterium]|jgi:ribosomal protein L7/L12|nr:hypothetical protein [Bacteroidales bacterium]
MALIACAECGNKVSNKAIACPHCGFPIGEHVINLKIRTINATEKHESETEHNRDSFLDDKICELLKEGNTLSAVKLCKDYKGIQLAEAKLYVDTLAQLRNISIPQTQKSIGAFQQSQNSVKTQKNSQHTGCMKIVFVIVISYLLFLTIYNFLYPHRLDIFFTIVFKSLFSH